MKNKKILQYIYGPVSSWRLGASLGIDPLSRVEKICSFDCVYCQLGKTKIFSSEREIYVPTDRIICELNRLPHLEIDYLTFAGRGEPTLAENLGEMIETLKQQRKEKIAVISNSSLIGREDVRRDLMAADFVLLKLDVCSQLLLKDVNNPVAGIKFESIIEGIKKFKAKFHGKLGIQIMFIELNSERAEEIAKIVRRFNADEVEINTPLRPCGVKPLNKKELDKIKKYFKGMNALSVYDVKKKKVEPISTDETLIRRGKI